MLCCTFRMFGPGVRNVGSEGYMATWTELRYFFHDIHAATHIWCLNNWNSFVVVAIVFFLLPYLFINIQGTWDSVISGQKAALLLNLTLTQSFCKLWLYNTACTSPMCMCGTHLTLQNLNSLWAKDQRSTVPFLNCWQKSHLHVENFIFLCLKDTFSVNVWPMDCIKTLLANILDVHRLNWDHYGCHLAISNVVASQRLATTFVCAARLWKFELLFICGTVCLQLDVYEVATTKATITSTFPPSWCCEPCVAHPHWALTLNSNTKRNMISQSTCSQFFLFPSRNS